jgi:hypothetical protein
VDAEIPMPALVSSMPMPSYGHMHNFSKAYLQLSLFCVSDTEKLANRTGLSTVYCSVSDRFSIKKVQNRMRFSIR